MKERPLVCPETKKRLHECSLEEAKARMESDIAPLRVAPEDSPSPPFGATPRVMLREDLRRAYPVVDSIPVLLAPEMLGPPEEKRAFDLEDPKYAEAYEEMAFYNEVSSREAEDIRSSESYLTIESAVGVSPREIASFPAPRSVWLDAPYDCAAQWDAYEHISPVEGKRALQLGGKGTHVVKLLLAGAAEAWAATPMLGEARCAMSLAREVGVENRLRCVVALAEELPFDEGSLDIVYSGGSMHHMVTDVAMPEVARVLEKGGKFAAMDPWRAPLYAIGTKMLGKREPNVHCRPLTKERVEPLEEAFTNSAVIQHGALTRYPLLALDKFGYPSSLSKVWRFNEIDDKVCSLVPGLRRMGSSVACLGTK